MSNPTDPTKPSPDQPDPNRRDADEKQPGDVGDTPIARSSFDFELPPDAGSYSDLPPVPQPDVNDTGPAHAALPSRPAAAPGGTNTSFDFFDLPPESRPPPAAAGDEDVFDFTPSGSPGAPSSITLGSGVLDLASLSDVPEAQPASNPQSVPDIASLFPPAAEAPSSGPDSFALPHPAVPELELPDLGPPSGVMDLGDLGLPGGSASDLFGSSVADLPAVEGASSVFGGSALELPTLDPHPSDSAVTLPALGAGLSDGKLAEPVAPVAPAAGWMGPGAAEAADVHEALPVEEEPAGAQPPSSHSGFDFQLPPSGELAAPLAPGQDSEVAVGNLEPAASVKPASGWLDADVLAALAAPPAGEPTSDPLAAPPPAAEAVESSDIFSGARAPAAQPVEQSDVIAATAYGTPAAEKPSEPVRPSEVALNFNAAPVGSTVYGGGGGDLPVAEEASSAVPLVGGGADPESIHDMPDPAADPLFDSSRLAGAPDLPPTPAAHADAEEAPDYGSSPEISADASSILADLVTPAPGRPGQDSSRVPVEAPGMGRTLTPAPEEVGFDLTVPDEPIPVELFDEPGEPTDWHSQSGSDLFADRRAAPELEDSGRVQPIDPALAPEEPSEGSLSTAPSSIFAGVKPPAGSGSASRPGDLGPAELTEADLSEAAEFSDHPTTGETAELAAPRAGHSSADFQLPPEAGAAEDDGGAIDWDAAELSSDEGATRGIPRDASLSAIIRGYSDGAETEAATRERPRAGADEEGPVVTVDWMANSGEGPAMTAPIPPKAEERPAPRREEKERPARSRRAEAGTGSAEKARPARAAEPGEKEGTREYPVKKGGGVLAGALAGALLASAALAGVYFSGLVPNSEKTAALPPPPPPNNAGSTATPPPTVQAPGAGPRDAFAAGDFSRALELLKAQQAVSAEDRAAAGSIRVYSKVHGSGTDADLKQGREDLKAVIAEAETAKSPESVRRAVKATVDLGVSYEAAGDHEAARKLFTEARAKFPGYAEVFDALLDRMEGAGGTSFRLTPADAERVLLSVGVLLADDNPKAEEPKGDLPEPGLYYWKAVRQARDGNYKQAVELIGKAKEAHLKRAKALAGRGLNPLTDPLEQMFPRSCDELAAYWRLKGELYANPAVAEAIKKDGVAKALDALARSAKEAATAKADLAKAEKDVATARAERMKAEKDLTAAKTELGKAEKGLTGAKADLKLANDKATKLEGEAAKLGKDVKAAEKARLEAEDKLKVAATDAKALEKKLAETSEALVDVRKQAKERQEALAAVARELRPAVKLPEKWTPADLAAGAKSLASLVKEKDLKALADRLTKAETAAKVATDKLATETKRLADKYEGDIKKLKEGNTAELKTLTDSYAADLKKLKDENADAVVKLKEADAAAEKKVADARAAAEKKLRDQLAADTKKLKEDYEAALKAEQARTEAERKAAAVAVASAQKQLGGAVTPSQVLDVWLPVLTDLRRPADAEPAAALAKRALASSAPGSEDEAKAHTTLGMALLLKGQYDGARDEFQAARRSPAYKADRPWAKVADTGLEATADPLSPYRQPVVLPPVDATAAARSLDAGIDAYRAGRYEAAAAALIDAARNDPADPVAWYFLGAAHWALGKEDQAKKDFAQGAEREKVSPLPGRAISGALRPIQGTVRDALDKGRP